METERLIIDSIREADKEDYYINISHDKKVLETFICRYADTLEEHWFHTDEQMRFLDNWIIKGRSIQ